ncbi:MAG: DUF3789 domain-containing protein [Ruminococcus sp.]
MFWNGLIVGIFAGAIIGIVIMCIISINKKE